MQEVKVLSDGKLEWGADLYTTIQKLDTSRSLKR